MNAKTSKIQREITDLKTELEDLQVLMKLREECPQTLGVITVSDLDEQCNRVDLPDWMVDDVLESMKEQFNQRIHNLNKELEAL